MKINLETTIQQNKDILTSTIDGEKVMMSIRFGEYYGLGMTGSFIWDHIEQPIKIIDLVKLITDKFAVEKEKCFNDISPFLNDLLEKELIIATK
ncbi:MAG: lasso peptide biosynthesis PqqD family chaperone [Bacteroidales bacterium]